MVDVRLLSLALVCTLLLGWSKAEQGNVELIARVPSELNIFFNYAEKDLLERTERAITLVKNLPESYEADRSALLSGSVDFVITPRPFDNGESGGDLLHFPIATGGFVLVANVIQGHQARMKAKDLAKIFSGENKAWADPAILVENNAFKDFNNPIKVVTWDPQGYATVELKRFLEANSEGAWTASTTFSSDAVQKSDWQKALAYVKSTPGSITYVPFKQNDDLFPISIFVPQSADYVSPVLNHFVNALMPLKRESDLPKAQDTSAWKAFSLTDMRKMPPDGSCMSMPPYALSHFVYLVMKRNQASSQELKGAALAAFIRVIVSHKIQNTASSTSVVTYIPVAAHDANVESINSINFKTGQSLLTFLPDFTEDADYGGKDMPSMVPGTMGPDGSMGKMEPAPLSSVIAMIVCLLLSGVISVTAYIIYLKCRHGGSFAENATWVPWTIQKRTKAQLPF